MFNSVDDVLENEVTGVKSWVYSGVSERRIALIFPSKYCAGAPRIFCISNR